MHKYDSMKPAQPQLSGPTSVASEDATKSLRDASRIHRERDER